MHKGHSYIIGFLSLLLAAVPNLYASDFVHINWNTLLSDSVMPDATRTIDLGTDWQRYTYHISIDYPEYEPATKKELKILKRIKATPSDTLRYRWQIGISRKRGLGEAAIYPLVRKEGKWMKLTSYSLTVARQPKAPTQGRQKARSANGRYAGHSVLKSGKWVKIRVAEEGIYQLTPSVLKQMGFNDISRVKLYGYGGRVQNMAISYSGKDADTDDLEEVPALRRTDGLVFYANGILRWSDWSYSDKAKRYVSTREINPYSRYSYYFVTEGDNPQAIEEEPDRTSTTGTTVTTYPERILIENDAYSWYTSGRHLFDSYNFANGNSRNYTLATPGRDTAKTAWLTFRISAAASSTTTVSSTFNTKKLSTFTINATGRYDHAITGDGTGSIDNLENGENTLNIKTTSGHNARLDYICLNYDRQLQLNGKYLVFSHYLSGARTMALTGADASTQIWRIGQAGEPLKQIPASLSGNTLTFNVADPTRRFVAVNANATYPTPEIVGRVPNQDLHADSTADMVIIIPASGKLEEQATRLAEYHRQADNMRVRVVRADQLYNEFSSGTPDIGAYRRYMKMLYDRAENENDLPRYLLLFGSSLWDNRMRTSLTKGLNPDDYLLCYESENSVNEVYSYVTDDVFGLLDDGEGRNIFTEKIDLGIGRFPVASAAEAKVLVDKSIAYMKNTEAGAWKNTVYMLADDGDYNGHMKDADAVYNNIIANNPSMLVKRVYWDAYPRVTTATGNSYPEITELLKNAMKKGALVMNYSGHGAPYTLSHEQVLKLTDFKEFNSARVPMWITASCELTPFDMPTENIGESSMLNKNGSAIAFYSATRAVYSNENRVLNDQYMRFLLGKDANGRRYTIGDAARLAKVALVDINTNSLDTTSNKLKYALMGDPALTLKMPTEKVVIDEINGLDMRTGGNPQLKAGSIAKVKGHIETAAGNRLTDYKGTVSLLLQDSKDTIVCKNNTGEGSTRYTLYERNKTLYEGSDSIRNGTFETSIPIPLDINYSNQSGRLNIYAVNTDRTIEANGYTESFTIGGSENIAPNDTLGPAMFIYLNNPDFQNGGTVNETPYFYAILSDSDGINTTGTGVGHDLQLVVDHKDTYILNSYYENDFGSYTQGSVAYHLPALEAGKHHLFFRAWDLKNHSSSAVLDFNVEIGLRPQLLDVKTSKNPASNQTTFIISYDRPETETQFSIEVYDAFGRLWWIHNETNSTADGYYTINWNLTSNSGAALPSGLYLYKVRISCNGSQETTKTKKLVVRRQ